MLSVPWITGVFTGGFDWRQIVLVAAWWPAYFAYTDFTQLLRVARVRRAGWWPPVVTFGAVAGVLGVWLVVMRPLLLWWAPWFAVLLGTSVALVIRRAERSWLNDGVTLTAACLMTMVAAGLGAASGRAYSWLPPGTADGRVLVAFAVVLLYFLGTAPYVKTMIRDRGRPEVYAVSVGYHGLLMVLGWFVSPWTGGLGLLLLARAAGVPKLWPKATPKAIGLAEMGISTVVTLVAILGG